jgi:hypothetical protein
MVQIFTAQGRKNQKLSAGEGFAELYLLEEGSCNFRAEAHSDCEVLLLRRLHYQQLLREHGGTATKVASEHMLEVARKASKRIVNTPQPSVRCLLAGKDLKHTAATGEAPESLTRSLTHSLHQSINQSLHH